MQNALSETSAANHQLGVVHFIHVVETNADHLRLVGVFAADNFEGHGVVNLAFNLVNDVAFEFKVLVEDALGLLRVDFKPNQPPAWVLVALDLLCFLIQLNQTFVLLDDCRVRVRIIVHSPVADQV